MKRLVLADRDLTRRHLTGQLLLCVLSEAHNFLSDSLPEVVLSPIGSADNTIELCQFQKTDDASQTAIGVLVKHQMHRHEQPMQKFHAGRAFEKRGKGWGQIDRPFPNDPELQCGAGDVVLASKLPLRDLRCRLFESRYESGDITPIPVRVFLFRESVRTIPQYPWLGS